MAVSERRDMGVVVSKILSNKPCVLWMYLVLQFGFLVL